MKKLLLSGVLVVLALNAGVTRAEAVVCPELSVAIQASPCPSEEELSYTYRGYCSDSQRMYDQGPQLCLDYETYRRAKYANRWETADGKFDGYLSCDQAALARTPSRPGSVKVSTQGSVTRVVCAYGEGAVLTYRTKATCVADPGNCATDQSACKASCE